MGTMLRRQPHERIVELARGIVTDKLLVADLSHGDWQHALMLYAATLSEIRNLGAILVPVAPHMGGYWMNGHVPAFVVELIAVAKGDVPAINRAVREMRAALWPEGNSEAEPPKEGYPGN